MSCAVLYVTGMVMRDQEPRCRLTTPSLSSKPSGNWRLTSGSNRTAWQSGSGPVLTPHLTVFVLPAGIVRASLPAFTVPSHFLSTLHYFYKNFSFLAVKGKCSADCPSYHTWWFYASLQQIFNRIEPNDGLLCHPISMSY